LDRKARQISELELLSTREDFWEDNQKAQATLKQLNDLKSEADGFKEMYDQAVYLLDLWKMAEDESDEALRKSVRRDTEILIRDFREFEMHILFAGPHDAGNAIIAIHPGAGGTESQDWGDMLLRMYTRWAEKSGYQVEMLDYQPGDEAGLKSATLMIKGPFAYGKLHCENGVHRLIRISPFDAAARRHTSFTSLSVMPEIDDAVEVNVNPEDLKVDTYRSSGAGGQHINKTDSAVRITHLPTGVVVQCQNERSQHSNRAMAMKMLLGKLYELEQMKMAENRDKIMGDHKEIAWGSQIRTYTLNPFSLAKDHRTGREEGNVGAVLDGDLDDFIYTYLQWQHQNARSASGA
jgi:peptide chain release factor 2